MNKTTEFSHSEIPAGNDDPSEDIAGRINYYNILIIASLYNEKFWYCFDESILSVRILCLLT